MTSVPLLTQGLETRENGEGGGPVVQRDATFTKDRGNIRDICKRTGQNKLSKYQTPSYHVSSFLTSDPGSYPSIPPPKPPAPTIRPQRTRDAGR